MLDKVFFRSKSFLSFSENGNSSNIVSTSEDNEDDDNSDFERDSTRRGHNIVTMRVAAPPTSAFYEGGGAGSQMVDVDLTPPDKLLKMATDRAAKLASKKRVGQTNKCKQYI